MCMCALFISSEGLLDRMKFARGPKVSTPHCPQFNLPSILRQNSSVFENVEILQWCRYHHPRNWNGSCSAY